MAIVGFNFTKIDAERKEGSSKGKIDINNNVAIVGVEQNDLALGSSSQKAAKVLFDFSVKYQPDVGSMHFTGDVLYLAESAKVDSLMKEWKKSKRLPKEIAAGVINTVLTKCNIQALILSQQINLPAPIQLPRVKIEEAPAAAPKSK